MMADLRVSSQGANGRQAGCQQLVEKPSSPAHGLAVDLLVGALLGEHLQLVRRVREAMQAELPVYRSVPDDALDIDVGLQLGLVLRSVAGGGSTLSDQAQRELAAVGAQQARQGVPMEDMLRAWRIGIHVVVGYAHEVAHRLGIADTEVLAFVQSALLWSDLILVSITRAHREAERVGADERQARFVRRILQGTMSCAEATIEAEMYGLDPGREYVAFRARLREDGGRLELEQALGLQESVQHRRGLCAVLDGYAAGFLTEAPRRHVDGVVGFGPARPLKRVAESYRLALRALATAEACGLHGAYDIASLGLRPAVALDVDVGELLRRRYLEPLAAANSTSELIETLRTYLACGMHVERTATRLFVHQNTVRYRIARFEELTEASLGDIEVLFEVWWALELSAMDL
jgi:PucR C-terminal helix-turn-helix domain